MSRNMSFPGPRYQALLELLRAADTLWNASRVFLTRWDLSPSQFNILNLLHGQREGLSQIELGRSLLMHRSNVTGLVDRLEERGLVARRAHPRDRRAYRVMLAPAGTKLLSKILPHYHRAAEDVWGRFPRKRAGQLVSELREVAGNAERIAENGKP